MLSLLGKNTVLQNRKNSQMKHRPTVPVLSWGRHYITALCWWRTCHEPAGRIQLQEDLDGRSVCLLPSFLFWSLGYTVASLTGSTVIGLLVSWVTQ